MGRRPPVPHMRSAPPAGARWCETHNRLECTRQRSRGRGACHGPAVRGTDRCRSHLGVTVDRARAQVLGAWAAVPGDDGITPAEAVAGQLGLAWRRAALLSALLAEQASADGGSAAAGAGTGGLVGHVWSADKSAGGIYPTGEKARALADLEARERELVVKFAKVASEMGVAERQARVDAMAVYMLSAIVDALLAALGHNPNDQRVRATVARVVREHAALEASDGT